jgi:hypothetical protein
LEKACNQTYPNKRGSVYDNLEKETEKGMHQLGPPERQAVHLQLFFL